MKRLIKFRAWDKSTNAMIYFDLTDIYKKELAQGHYQTMIKEVCFEHPVYGVNPDIILMQDTGLHDKGTEIYEGDIVKMHYFSEGLSSNLGVFEKENSITGDIQYRQDFATYVVNTKDQDYTISEYCQEPSEELEVIGNIYEGGTPNE